MKNIILIGFMGTGKSTVGKRLADELGLKFIDSDEVIKESAGSEIGEIFATKGEAYFRDLETEVIADLGQKSDLVISTGGGAVLREKNVELLKEQGIVILLKAEPEVILERVRGTDRPLLAVADPIKEIKKLLTKRKSYYDITKHKIDTSNLEVDEVVNRIKEIMDNT
ncbi:MULTISPECIES: shikimate kinase [unclassified Candidatus Frackibacter]|uniref:shikimate kinase n=1 Tax=unclassified Candidatus Frackibacter TaxID=2648818 RepID=UPI0007960A2F|nr:MULTISPECIES: shikimate kinase [unclassified Candidatus Frackibacter]KXS45955.1 MAG: shikimate kinase [Candidatus Frackibacter sp. T328-2]SDC03300.1 shikimate kinase [Candidatus Frackibacter sp. WG11]SEM69078.1 shikimate kinase [Candidatus Frackibacter sp. WG12]SFL80372.1 shikimate kinase [Candidatus Frackibacter sp. WG13]